MNIRKIVTINFIVCTLLLTGACTNPKETELTALDRLLHGNQRYLSFHSIHPHQTRQRLKEITSEQNPFAIVVSCSDARVPPEIIFDQGLGDLFVIRTAGNIIGDYELASIEYAVQKLKCEVIMILGHDGCGAIRTFIEQPLDSLPGHINEMINFIRNQPNAKHILEKSDDPSYPEVINNILYEVDLVKNNSTIIRENFNNKKIEIYGAIYHMESGQVQIIADEIKK